MGTFRTVRPTRTVRPARPARPVRGALVAALTVCALSVPAAPAAVGEEPGPGGTGAAPPDATGTASIRVTPATARPGAEVEVAAPRCEGTAGTARSEAFVADAALAPSADGGLFGEARIRSDVEEGRHRVTVECEGAGTGAVGRLTVRRSASDRPSSDRPSTPAASPSGSPAASPADSPSPARSPVAPVPAGGGGTAERTEDAGPGALHTTLGAGLAGAAVLTVAWRALASRRRNRSDTDH